MTALPAPAATDAGPDPRPCPTRALMTQPPDDLVSWAEAAAGLAHTPYPMTERSLRRAFKADPHCRTWRSLTRRGELVSMSDVFAYQRDRADRERAERGQALTA